MRFQNFWEDFVDFLDSVVSQAKKEFYLTQIKLYALS